MYQPSNRFGTPPVVLNLIILNVIVYVLTHFLFPNLIQYFLLFYPAHIPGLPPEYHFEPYQLVTYMFGHANFWHIALNMLALWMLGGQVEMVWGGKKFLVFYLACGLGAAGFNFLIDYIQIQNGADVMKFISPMLGASGAIFGILAAFGMMFPNQVLMLLFPPIPLKAKYFVLLYGALELFSGLSSNPGDNVAHFAHLGGGLTGLLLLLFWKSRGELYKPM
jgi:membrane associated rhomboid family serine protease